MLWLIAKTKGNITNYIDTAIRHVNPSILYFISEEMPKNSYQFLFINILLLILCSLEDYFLVFGQGL